jgi:hypothetical protein
MYLTSGANMGAVDQGSVWGFGGVVRSRRKRYHSSGFVGSIGELTLLPSPE